MLDSNGGSGVGNGATFAKYGSTLSIPNNPSRTGYVFRGWTTTRDGSDFYDFSKPVAENFTLYAKWEKAVDYTKADYKVIWYGEDLDGDYEELASSTYTGTIDANVKAEQKKFEGYEYDPNNRNDKSFGNVASDGSLTLKLYYDRVRYDIEVDTDGDGTLDEDVTGIYGERYDDFLPKYVKHKDGLKFAGWYSQKDGKGKRIKDSTKIEEDTYYRSIYAYFNEDGIEEDEENSDFEGTVEYDDGKAAKNVTIKLEQNGKTINKEDTDSKGKFSFDKLSSGFYNVVLEDSDNDTVNTYGIHLTSKTKSTDYEVPSGELSSVVEASGLDKNIVVDGFYDSVMKYVDDDAELRKLYNGSGTLEYTVNFKDYDSVDKAPNDFSKLINKTNSTDYVFSMSIDQNTKGGSSSSKSKSGIDLNDTFKVYVPVKDTKNIKVYFANKNSSELLKNSGSSSSSSESYYVDTTNSVVVINTSRSGSYVVTTSDNTITSTNAVITSKVLPDASLADVKLDKSIIKVGDTVNVTITTKAGHTISKVMVGSKDVTTDAKDGKFTITDVKDTDDIIVTIDCPFMGFKDVTANAWYHSSIDKAVANKFMSGYSADTFGPNDMVTRGQMAQIIYNIAKGSKVNSKLPFTDVPNDMWCYDVVVWCYSNGYMSGIDSKHFNPSGSLTREQLVQVLYNYDKKNNITSGKQVVNKNISTFADGKDITWSKGAMNWALKYGIIGGTTGNKLEPKRPATRAEIATIVSNLFLK